MMTPIVMVLLVLPSQPPVAEGLPVPVPACRKVVAAITQAAQEVARPGRPQLSNDERTRVFLRAAAQAALRLPADQQVAAFSLGIAIGLDDSTILTGNFLFGRALNGIESAEERMTRLQVLGSPSLQSRRDWCQHFVVSVGLVTLAGSEASRAAGLLKEQLDARPGASGFSLADYAADEAGIRLGELLVQNPQRLRTLAEKGELAGLLPPLKDFSEGWHLTDIEKKFGGLNDPRFQAELDRVRMAVRKQPGIEPPP